MILYLKRTHYNKDGNYVIGTLELKDFVCNTLENYELMIPEGEYGVYKAYHSKFNSDVFEVLDVPNRSAILIHPGNTQEDTKGCILVGRNTKPATVSFSRLTLQKLISLFDSYSVAVTPILYITT